MSAVIYNIIHFASIGYFPKLGFTIIINLEGNSILYSRIVLNKYFL